MKVIIRDIKRLMPTTPHESPSSFLESLSKATAAGLFAIYVCGFIVISLQNASFGFSELSPLRPKILSAGTLFLCLTLLPILSAKRVFRDNLQLNSEQRIARTLLASFSYFSGCAFLAFSLSRLYVFPIEPNDVHRLPKRWIGVTFLIAVIVIAAIVEIAWKNYKEHPKKVAVFSALLMIFSLSWVAIQQRNYVFYAVELWFFGTGCLAAIVDKVISDPEKRAKYEWERLLLPIIAALSIFSPYIYPRIKSSWGGGAPIPVIIYFGRDSRLMPAQQLSAQMLDESDNGFYILQNGQKKALFVPRSAVAAIYFSDKELPATFLDTAKSPTLQTSP